MEYAELFALRLRRRVASSDKPRIAKELGVSMSALHNYLAGRSLPSVDVAVSLAKLCGLGDHLQWLFGDTSDSVEPPEGDEPGDSRLLADATPHQLLEHLVDGYLNIALPLREKLDELVGNTEIDYTAIWLLSNTSNQKVTDPIRDMAKLLYGLGTMTGGLWLYDFDAALAEEIRRRKLDWTPAELSFSFLRGDWEQLRKENPGVDAILEYMGADEPGHAFEPFDPDARIGVGPRKDWLRSRAPYLLARLVTHENNEFNPKVQPLIEMLKRYGYLDKDGKPTEPEWLEDGFPIEGFFDNEPEKPEG